MTNSSTVELGRGGFGRIYKGELNDGTLAAVKAEPPHSAMLGGLKHGSTAVCNVMLNCPLRADSARQEDHYCDVTNDQWTLLALLLRLTHLLRGW
ncbi:hypothetical protein L484_021681 [Morus notabilis]|uniref:Protein kinase domain-containing protein n=1 Tax=Morus notabilis TaxID=981085 RepID=W9S6T1_9ROSA|nr:hypothetical protein L484_021681 [Morus notabilis]